MCARLCVCSCVCVCVCVCVCGGGGSKSGGKGRDAASECSTMGRDRQLHGKPPAHSQLRGKTHVSAKEQPDEQLLKLAANTA